MNLRFLCAFLLCFLFALENSYACNGHPPFCYKESCQFSPKKKRPAPKHQTSTKKSRTGHIHLEFAVNDDEVTIRTKLLTRSPSVSIQISCQSFVQGQKSRKIPALRILEIFAQEYSQVRLDELEISLDPNCSNDLGTYSLEQRVELANKIRFLEAFPHLRSLKLNRVFSQITQPSHQPLAEVNLNFPAKLLILEIDDSGALGAFDVSLEKFGQNIHYPVYLPWFLKSMDLSLLQKLRLNFSGLVRSDQLVDLTQPLVHAQELESFEIGPSATLIFQLNDLRGLFDILSSLRKLQNLSLPMGYMIGSAEASLPNQDPGTFSYFVAGLKNLAALQYLKLFKQDSKVFPYLSQQEREFILNQVPVTVLEN